MKKNFLFLITLFFLNLFIFSLNIDAAETETNLILLAGPTATPTPTPTPTVSSSTSSTSSPGGWSPPSCNSTKPSSAPMITNIINNEDNSVTLNWIKAKETVTHYLVAYGTKSGSIEYGNPNIGNSNTTNYIIKGLSGGTKYYFKIKAINDCMPGDWSNEVSSKPKGKVIKPITTETTGEITTVPAEGFVPVSQLPSQLFDIALIVDQPKVNKASDLNARVTFISFGREETPVQMTFVIVDDNGKEYYRSVDRTSIQTEGIFNKTFKDLILPNGKYILILTTVYNTNIKDEFKQEVEVGEEIPPSSNNLLMIIIGSGIILIVLSWIIILMRKRKNN